MIYKASQEFPNDYKYLYKPSADFLGQTPRDRTMANAEGLNRC